MIGWLLKNWKLFLDILLVVGGIILFTLFDPFGVFSKQTLKSTANILSSVKSIGELVTAEYYGEVISSLHGTNVYDLKPDTLNQEFENCFIELKNKIVEDVLDELGDQSRLKDKQKRSLNRLVAKENYFREIKNDYKKNNIYNHLITFLGVHNIRNDVSFFYKKETNDPLRKRAEKRVSEYLLAETFQTFDKIVKAKKDITPTEFSEYIYAIPSYFKEAAEFHYKVNQDDIKEPKQDIVFIGRGWVKAGFRFNKLDKSNVYYDYHNKMIHFYGLSPVVLDNDINPWFIPEKKVKGFELVDFYKKATFEEANAVKIKCKEKLLEQAKQADIIQQAQKNGEESLQSFFALLTNQPDLKVRFHNLPYQNELNMISADTLITVNEALLIDSLISTQIKKISTAMEPNKEHYQQQLTIFINQLLKLSFIQKDTPFNLFMLEAAKILAHKRFITQNDSIAISKIRHPIIELNTPEGNKTLGTISMTDNTYFSPYPNFVDEFNSMLTILEKEIAAVDDFRSDSSYITQHELKELNLDTAFFGIETVSYAYKLDSVQYLKVFHKQTSRSFSFTDFNYPVLQIPEEWQDTIHIADTSNVDILIDSLIRESDNYSGNIYYDSLRNNDLAHIKHHKSQEIKKTIKTRPVKHFTSTVHKLFGKK